MNYEEMKHTALVWLSAAMILGCVQGDGCGGGDEAVCAPEAKVSVEGGDFDCDRHFLRCEGRNIPSNDFTATILSAERGEVRVGMPFVESGDAELLMEEDDWERDLEYTDSSTLIIRPTDINTEVVVIVPILSPTINRYSVDQSEAGYELSLKIGPRPAE